VKLGAPVHFWAARGEKTDPLALCVLIKIRPISLRAGLINCTPRKSLGWLARRSTPRQPDDDLKSERTPHRRTDCENHSTMGTGHGAGAACKQASLLALHRVEL
jgi:hypothetical protein